MSTQKVVTDSTSRRREKFAVIEDGGGLLAEAKQFGAELVFDLGAVEGFGSTTQAFDDIGAGEDAAAALHVVELDGEAVGGSGHFALAQAAGARVSRERATR